MQISGLTHGTNVWLGNAQDLIKDGTCDISRVIGTRDGIMLDMIRYGLENATAFKIMEAVRKGKGLTPEWEADMRAHNVPEWYITSCKKIKYLFPKAHAAAYVMSAIRLAWYKVHQPVAFYCTMFTVAPNGFDAQVVIKGKANVVAHMRDIQKRGKEASQKEQSSHSPLCGTNWASHVILMNASLPLGIRYWYMKQAVEMGWSSTILKMQIESNLFKRQIEARKVSNFTAILPSPQSDLANYLLKDPYIFDMAGAKEAADERDIEQQLVGHITKYLLEMGNGFAFVAKQKHFQVGNSDFYADLILYNIRLHAYVVVELKATPFKPEYAGQLNFYINVVDEQMRGEKDNKTIGLLLCKGKDEVVAQYALRGYDQPIGVSDYQLSKAVPEDLKSTLPTIEEMEEELTLLLDKNK